MGFFRGLDAEKYDRQYSDRILFLRIASLFKPYGFRLALVSLLVFLVGGLWAMVPLIIGNGLDWLRNQATSQMIAWLVGLFTLAGVIRWLLNWLQRRMLVKIIAEIMIELARKAFASAVAHDLSFFDQFSSGRMLSRITTDTRDFGNFIQLFTDLLSQVVESLVLGIILLRIDPHMSFLIFALIPFVAVLAFIYRKIARNVTQQGMRAMADVNSSIKETISGISIAKNFRQDSAVFEEFDHANRASYQLNVRRGLILAFLYPLLNVLGGVMTGLLVYFGGARAIQGVITAGAWYLFIFSMDSFLHPILNLSSFIAQIQTGLAAVERIFALIDVDPAVRQSGQTKPPALRGQIEFKDVSFHYREGENILQNFNLLVPAGENLAIVGHTGAGKTSLIKLIARFYEFQGGQLQIDGMDIRSFDLAAYRRQLGIVSQTPFLFSGTVLENIRYAHPEGTDRDIEEMAHKIGGGEWLETLPAGLQTEVGERGALLSMGQRQLVSLMRVLVQQPAIFILDEATASIDPFTEWQIQQVLKMILAQSTSILIAHRLSTVKTSDRIIVMEDGQIIEEGTHLGLLKNARHYAKLYNTYFRHQSLEYIEQARLLEKSERR
ncbi:MAG: ABC transporter ATP-binding protein [Anaerolineaceae bacterium]|nr:ABC transporter ATP-binding protein [Anaerolineaceae bacterium]